MKSKRKLSDRIFPFALIVIVILLVVKMFFFDYWIVKGDSMRETYHNGDIVFINKYKKEMNRFDVIVCKTPIEFQRVIKRIIALPNETILIDDGKIYINGVLLNDCIDVKISFAGVAEQEYTLKSNEYFVLGDNRNNSADSRNFGGISSDKIIGIVIE